MDTTGLEHWADWLLFVHKLLGLVTVLIVGPTALLVTVGGKTHRRAGVLYFVCMTLLYFSGTYFTFEKHELLDWKFWRNLSFNGFGYYTLVLAYLAVPLKGRQGMEPARRDHIMNTGLVVISLVMLTLGFKKWPMGIFGVLGLILAWIDRLEFKEGAQHASVLLDRHIRYMMCSYYYVVTVVSILVFPSGLKVKWAWPALVAIAATTLLTNPELRHRLGWSRLGTQNAVLRFTSALAFAMGATALYQILSEGTLIVTRGG